MKKYAKYLIPLTAALLLCICLTACGADAGADNTAVSTTDRNTESTLTTERPWEEMMRDNGETVSEMVSENFSAMREESFLDPQNGIISDTQPN